MNHRHFLLIPTILLLKVASGNIHENLAETKQRGVKHNEEFLKGPVGHALFTVLEVFSIVLLLILVFLIIVRVMEYLFKYYVTSTNIIVDVVQGQPEQGEGSLLSVHESL